MLSLCRLNQDYSLTYIILYHHTSASILTTKHLFFSQPKIVCFWTNLLEYLYPIIASSQRHIINTQMLCTNIEHVPTFHCFLVSLSVVLSLVRIDKPLVSFGTNCYRIPTSNSFVLVPCVSVDLNHEYSQPLILCDIQLNHYLIQIF